MRAKTLDYYPKLLSDMLRKFLRKVSSFHFNCLSTQAPGGGGGDSHVKVTGVSVGILENSP